MTIEKQINELLVKYGELLTEFRELQNDVMALKRKYATREEEGEERPLSVNELAAALGKSPDTVRRWEKKRLIPCRRVKYRKKYSLMFYRSEVETALDKYKRYSL